MFFHEYCNHDRWAYFHILKEAGTDVHRVAKGDGRIKKLLRLFTMGNLELETGGVFFIMILLKLDWLAVLLFGIWAPVRWAVQTLIFVHDLKPGRLDKKLDQTY
jgi:hypothetical protein